MIVNGDWDKQKVLSYVLAKMAGFIIDKIKLVTEGISDKPWSTENYKGQFTVKSAYNTPRCKKNKHDWFKIWSKVIPYKISFFLWRVFKERIPTDDILKRMKISVVSRCYCCDEGRGEIVEH